MDVTDVKKLFSGIAIIIDNEIGNRNTAISKIKTNLEENNIPVVCFPNIPEVEMIPSFGDASFIILDWNFSDNITDEISGMSGPDVEGVRQMTDTIRIQAGAELERENQERVIDFIRDVMKKLFVPIFIFSGFSIDQVTDSLTEAGLYDTNSANRVFIKSKDEVADADSLFMNIGEWLKKMPSVYALKEVELRLRDTKNRMFNEWDGYSPRWVTILWDLLKNDWGITDDDSMEAQLAKQDLGNFIVRNLTNRVTPPEMDAEMLGSNQSIDVHEMRKVLEGERYIRYDPDHHSNRAFTGDLYRDGEYYYLNVRAQCDLSRIKRGETSYNPDLYLIEGTELDPAKVVSKAPKIDKDYCLEIRGRKFDLRGLKKENKGELNTILSNYSNQNNFAYGEILEKKTEVILSCVDNGKIIVFRLDLMVRKFRDMRDRLIGRVLPPYITRIQQKCSQYIVREGVMPLPREIFDDN